MLGYSQSEMRIRKIWDVTRPADYDEVSIARNQLLEGAISSHSMEKRYIRKNGTAFWGRLNRSLVRDHDNLPQYFIAVVEDITEKRQADQALRDSEQRLRLAVSTGVGVWEHDLRSRIPALSPQYNRAVGRAPLTSQEWFNLVHPDDRERVMALVRESINGLSEWNAEFRLLYPDGSIRWMLSKGTVLLDDDGRPERMAGVSIDITGRKRNEEALRRSEQRLELAQQVAGIGTWDWDVGTNETHCSSGYGPLYGLPPGDLAPSPERWINLIYPEDRDRIRKGLDLALTHTHRFREEFRVVWPDGTIHWIYGEGQVLRNTEGNPIRMIGVNVDIDERKRADAALRESEARFRNLADTAPVMIWVIGPDKRATFFNKCCIDFTGSALEEKLGNGWVAGLHPEDRDQFLTVFSSSIDARRQFRAVFRLRRADGEYRWVLCTGVPRSAPDDTFSGYTGSCLDITELKRTEEEALARHKLESVGVLAGGIAHDFNNLLGSILMEAEIATAELAAGLSPDEEITKISTIAMRGAEIVRQLMVYSGEDQAGAVEPVDLSRLTAEMLELMGVSISKQAVLKSNLDKNLPAVWGNAPQIRQVLMNLVINASEAIGEKEGVIHVTTSRVTGGEASGLNNAANAPADGYVRLTCRTVAVV
jgi:PAS domain S-box-containing protein